jgi:tetratricopeptide (TPR) repeat protein
MELGKGQPLLMGMFSGRWDVISRKITPDQQRLLKDVFLDYLSRNDPKAAVAWAEKLEKSTPHALDAGLLRIARAEVHLYYLGQPEVARALLEGLVAARQSEELVDRARIRLGDVEFLSAHLNEATALYAEVQNRVGKGRARLKPAAAPVPATNPDTDFGATVKAEFEARRQQLRNASATPSAEKVADWKVNALLDTAGSETVKSLLAQDFLLEARQALQQWEREFPLSKVSGDFLLNEANLYLALGDWKRANILLSAYCENIDASSYLPEAAVSALRCKRTLEEPRDSMIAFCRKMKKKLEFHPAGEKINDELRRLGVTE